MFVMRKAWSQLSDVFDCRISILPHLLDSVAIEEIHSSSVEVSVLMKYEVLIGSSLGLLSGFLLDLWLRLQVCKIEKFAGKIVYIVSWRKRRK